MTLSTLKFATVLFGLAQALKFTRRRHPEFAARLKERNLVAQIIARDEEVGRWFAASPAGGCARAPGVMPSPTSRSAFKNAALGAKLLTPPINWLDQINAQKDFKLTVDGPEDLTNWFAQTMMMIQTVRWKIGMTLADGTMRTCNMTNGGPVFVYVKDGKIAAHHAHRFRRQRPAALDDRGARPQAHAAAQHHARAARPELQIDGLFARPAALSDEARRFRSQRRAQSAEPRQVGLRAHLLGRGARPSSHREIKRLKSAYGPGVMAVSHGSHHTWGNIGYYLSALHRFKNAVGHTAVHHNPDSWEGWYWGAVHHWGYSLRVGQSETYGTVEDCLQNCDMIVFWSADPGDHQRLLRRAGRHRAAPMAQEPQARHQDRPRRSLLQRLGPVPAGQVVRAAAHHLGRDGDGDRLCLDQGRALRQGLRRHPHGRLRQVEGLSPRRGGRRGQDAGMAGGRDRRSGQGRARAGPRMGQKARLSRARRLGQRPWRRLPQPDRHPVGARHGLPHRHAGARQARRQHGQPAMGLPDRLQLLFPGLCRWRHVGRSRRHLDAGRALSAHAAASDHEHALSAHPAHLHARGDRRRQGRGLSLDRQVDRASIRASSPIPRPAMRRSRCSTSMAARSWRP